MIKISMGFKPRVMALNGMWPITVTKTRKTATTRYDTYQAARKSATIYTIKSSSFVRGSRRWIGVFPGKY